MVTLLGTVPTGERVEDTLLMDVDHVEVVAVEEAVVDPGLTTAPTAVVVEEMVQLATSVSALDICNVIARKEIAATGAIVLDTLLEIVMNPMSPSAIAVVNLDI